VDTRIREEIARDDELRPLLDRIERFSANIDAVEARAQAAVRQRTAQADQQAAALASMPYSCDPPPLRRVLCMN